MCFAVINSPLCWYAMSITGSMEAAEEIVEELFYGFWRDRGEAAVVPFYEKLSLYCGAQSVFSILRASGGEKQISGVCPLAEGGGHRIAILKEEMEYQELRHLIDATLARMPERRLRIFRMCIVWKVKSMRK